MPPQKQKFRNDSGGHIGVVVLGVDGKPHGRGVAPGEEIALSEVEQQLTAEAPKRAEDSPFANGALTPITGMRPIPATRPFPANPDTPAPPAEPTEEPSMPPQAASVEDDGSPAPTEEIGAAVEPQGDPPEGEYAAEEEVATPEAPAAKAPPKKPPARAKAKS